jgi:tripartite-type tricarboxylate transporter receptor subunit TctC
MVPRILGAGRLGIAVRQAATVALAFFLFWPPAQAQEYPNREIRLVVGYDAGSTADQLARYFAERIRPLAAKPIVVENRSGALTRIAAEYVARARPDGYVVLVTSGNSTFSTNPHVFKRLNYDPFRDFTPVTTLLQLPFLLITRPAAPFASVPELTAYARTRGKAATYGFANTFGLAAGELYNSLAGIEATQVSYRNPAAAITDLLGGQVDYVFLDALFTLEPVNAGRIKALATTGARRMASLPALPTMQESGVAGFELTGWLGVWLPAGAAEPVVEKLAGWFNRVVADAETRDLLLRYGGDPFPGSPQSLRDFMAADYRKWADVLKAANVEPQ